MPPVGQPQQSSRGGGKAGCCRRLPPLGRFRLSSSIVNGPRMSEQPLSPTDAAEQLAAALDSLGQDHAWVRQQLVEILGHRDPRVTQWDELVAEMEE